MDAEPQIADFTLIDKPAHVPALLEVLHHAEIIAIDTEADSFHHFHHKVCLIQLAVGQRCFIVDPLVGLDLSEMMAILSRKRLIFHDAGYDLRMLLADFGFRPQGEIFDTMLAARLTGRENIGLSSLLEDILGIQLSKHNQRANWAIRPLTQQLLAYAAEDIRYLAALAEHLAEQLQSLGRLEWHREYCQWTIEQTQQPKEPQDPDKSWRIRGTFGLTPRQLAIVKAIWQWRQAQADQADISPFRILRNEDLINLALWADRQKQIRPDAVPRLPRHCQGHRRQQLLEAVRTACGLRPDQWPKPPQREHNRRPEAEILDKADRMKEECRKIADQLGIEPQVIASRKSLLAAVNTHADTEEKLLRIGWMRWQIGLLIEPLKKVLAETADKDTANENCHV